MQISEKVNLDKCLAHIDQKNIEKKQSLYMHLINTAKGSKEIADKVGMGNLSYLVGLLHDIGKIRNSFQEKLKGDNNTHVDHSTLGGIFILKIFYEFEEDLKKQNFSNWEDIIEILKKDKIAPIEIQDYTNILIYAIMSHHGQYDLVRKNEDNKVVYTSFDRINNLKKAADFKYDDDFCLIYREVEKFFESKDIYIKDLYKRGFNEYLEIIKKLENYSKEISIDTNGRDNKTEAMLFYKSMLIRLIVSILKSADIKDSINAYEEIILDEDKDKLKEIKKTFEYKIRKKYEGFGQALNKIDRAREKISNNITKRSMEDKTGIYKLDLPTGAGKTLLSLKYGINQMNYQNKERFFYVTSFLSVLEQNANEMKKVLANDTYVLEHHSNIINDDLEKEDDMEDDSLGAIRKKYLFDDWTSPVILTTTVQFYNSIFKGKSSNLTRFKSLINSVVILDEWQSVPTKFLYITNLSLNFLKLVMNTTIVLSTATQPTNSEKVLRHKLSYGDLEGKNEALIEQGSYDAKTFERVKLKVYGDVNKFYHIEEIKKLVMENLDKSNLIILNTKKVVKRLYELLESDYNNDNLYYLTTNLTAWHRLKIIEEIKNKLKNGDKICVISTQLIESGVDVDFDFVIRSLTGMDSVIQAMGRCNREGKKDIAYTYLINLDKKEENISFLKGMEERKRAGEYILKDIYDGDYNLEDIIEKYFKKLYANIDNSKLVDTLELLGRNTSKKDAFLKTENDVQERILLNLFQSFKEAYTNFEFIDNRQKTAIVDYEETKRDLEEIRDMEKEYIKFYDFKVLRKIKDKIRKLSRHTVTVSDKDINDCENILDGTLYIVTEKNYDEKLGLTFEESSLFNY